MENICCVCLEETKKVTNCQHFLCRECYSKMYGKKCPMCRQNITKSSYRRIKKVKCETENVEHSTGNSENYNQYEVTDIPRWFNSEYMSFLQGLQEITDPYMEQLNEDINQRNQVSITNATLTQTQP
jgi:hypothetical protein